MSHVASGTLQIHVQTLGDPASARPPVLLLHGLLLGSLATWYFGLAPRLARARRVILYDLRGHGRSDTPPTGYTMDDHLADLEAVLEACAAHGPVALVGHSFGGLIALHHALRAPERVCALALIETPLPPSQAELGAPADRVDPTSLLDALPAQLRETLLQGGRRGRRFLARLHALCENTDLLATLAQMGDLPDATLAALPVRTLALYGRTSSCLPTGERLARLLPEARLEILPGGHFLPVESPAAVTGAVERFLHG